MIYLKKSHGKWQQLHRLVLDKYGLSFFSKKGKYEKTWNGNKIYYISREKRFEIK